MASEEILACATCGDGPDGLGSSCARCKKPMHHFCATDVCQKLGLKSASGEDMFEFPNDVSYCSPKCYNKAAGVVRAGKNKRVRQPADTSDSDFEEEDNVRRKLQRKPERRSSVEALRPSSNPVHQEKPTEKTTSEKKKKLGQMKTAVKTKEAEKRQKKAAALRVPKTRDGLVGKMVAFCADNEDWMSASMYSEAKGMYVTGRLFLPGETLSKDTFEVRWTLTIYQTPKYFHRISRSKAEDGIRHHATIAGGVLNKATWKHICRVPEAEVNTSGQDLDDFVILDGSSDLFMSQQALPASLKEVEKIKSLDFQPTRRMVAPSDLYTHDDGTTGTKLIKEKRHHFETASSSFFAYLPVSYWKTVVTESNDYANADKGAVITLDELMRFLGILFYMTVVVKGEYSNYWGKQAEDEIFGTPSSAFGLDNLMTLKRFQFIRKYLSFRSSVTEAELRRDPVARIRPLMNMLKITSTKYVVLGRNVAVDESSIACRSKYGRHLIVYNSSKPTGKYHFKIYACCCSTSWLMVGFRLHCSSEMEDRLQAVTSVGEAVGFEYSLRKSSAVRQIVLEVTKPLHGTKRVVNTDNFYTSVTLLLSLRNVGMYGRGTIREGSLHFPKAHMFGKKSDEPRGSSMQGVSNTGEMVAASWMDGSTVNIISNADSSDMGHVTRLVGKEKKQYSAPVCLAEYNQNMQGVDRLDQLRAKYSYGHSMKKWHKKLALAFIDLARVNAYVTKCLNTDTTAKANRSEHRQFMIELASELISGKWKETAEDDGMLFADDTASSSGASVTNSPGISTPNSPSVACDFVLSSEVFKDRTRGKRGCKVCIFEGRIHPTVKTNFCVTHNVCLCSNAYPIDASLAELVCPYRTWSCWRKYHEYYLPRGVWNDKGRIKRSSKLFVEVNARIKAREDARRRLQLEDIDEGDETTTQDPQVPAESPPTLVFSPFDHILANAQRTQSGWSLSSRGEDSHRSTPVASPPTLIFSPFDGANASAHGSQHDQSSIHSAFSMSPSSQVNTPREPVATPDFSMTSSVSMDYPS